MNEYCATWMFGEPVLIPGSDESERRESIQAHWDEKTRLSCAEEWRDWNAQQRMERHGTAWVSKRRIDGHKAHDTLERRSIYPCPANWE